ncbi:uncharacterized protein LOC110817856 [Carica papaya]|uniref:uncharacterized protein LOC110817856 n=1 Tax=Carica papaya TaxID=3649 RepID=UPI000B8CF507|nr:uncharacterized protein LOC110817856 [Carica papaya]
MITMDWVPPCGKQCTKKFAALIQIPWRVFCKKGCSTDGDTWEECKHFSFACLQECFHACVAGCGFKFDIQPKEVDEVHPDRPSPPPVQEKKTSTHPTEPNENPGDVPSTSA